MRPSERAPNLGQLAVAKDLHLNDAFLDALADRLAARIFDRAKEIDAKGASAPK